ncbi:MAG: DUF1206 domain-containing protein [Cyanobacteria bacterium P01_G01_bin.38]
MSQSNLTQQKIEHQTAPWIRRLARFGYATKAVVYMLSGILAVQAAFNWGGKTTGSEGVLRTIAAQPFGQILLFLVGAGLIGYIVWRLVQAVRDPEHEGNDWSDVFRRLGYAASGLIYGGLAMSAFRLALGGSQSSGGGSSSTQSMASKLLAQPMGRWLVGAAGAFVIGLAFYYFYRAISAKFRAKLRINDLDRDTKQGLIRLCQFGIAARGVVFAVIGGYLIRAALLSDSSKARSTAGALDAMEYFPFGRWVLAVVAVGLVAYGVYMGVQARYRRIEAA